MKIAVIGGGVSGVSFAINRKRNHPRDEIFIFEHTDKLLKKVLATGNGKCNIANAGEAIYNNSLAISIVKKYNYDTQNQFLDSLNIKTKLMGNLSYPVSESAVTVRNAFLKELERLKIKVITNCNLLDYYQKEAGYVLKTDLGNYEIDSIIFAAGGKSLAKSGSDGSILPILEKHHYHINEFVPALCPIYTKEKTKLLDGTRVKANIKVLDNNKVIFVESGEVLFKEKGLSGIVIFNASRVIAHDLNKNYVICLDLLPDTPIEELNKFLSKHDKTTLLESYLHPNLAKYLENSIDVIKDIKSLSFNFDKLYGFENSQISVGGVSIDNLNDKLESKIEKNIYFAGELIDIDAPCGGYNLMWAIGSGLYISEII